MVPTITKYYAETFRVGVDFSELLAEGETLDATACQVAALASDGTDVTDQMLENPTVQQDTVLSVRLKANGGEVGSRYRLRFVGGTTSGDVFEEDLWLVVV